MLMTDQEIFVIGVTLIAMGLILTNKLRVDVVALLVLIVLGASRVITVEQAFAGLSQPVIITLFSLFILARSLEETGIVQWIGNRLRLFSGKSEARLMLAVMLAAIALSFFMNLVAVVALLMPAVIQAARDSDMQPSRVLIPLSFGSLLGGMTTYFATVNLLMSSVLVQQGYAPFTPLILLPTGIPIIIVGIAYMLLIGRRLLPHRESAVAGASARSLSRNLYEVYQLDERLWEYFVPPSAGLVGKTLRESCIGEELGVTVLGIWRGQQAILTPAPEERIRANDYLLILGRQERVTHLREQGLQIGRENDGRHYDPNHDYSVDLTEVIIPPRSTIIGKTLIDLRFRSKYRLTTVALWRNGRSYRTDVGKMPLQVGDALLMVGNAAQIRALAQESDFTVLQSGHAARPRRPHKARLALAIFAITIFVALTGIIPPAEVLLAGALAAILTGCLNMDEAYRAVEWRVIFTIAGMLPLSTALIQTGLAARVGDLLTTTFAPFGTWVFLGVLYLVVMLLTQALSAQVTVVIVGAIAVNAAVVAGIAPTVAAILTAAACSSAFLTQVSHPVNVLVAAPGGYRPADYPRVGFGLMVVVFLALMVGLAVFWGVR
jgi:di/tricarboxylate transporter